MKLLKSFFLFSLTFLSLLMFSNFSNAQTSGQLDFSVKITEPTGGYNNKLVIAIWLEDSATGTFVKTKLRRAQTEVQYLNVWISKSGQNVVDAVTGATTSPGTFNVLWNATNVAGNVVPDGTYNVWIQFSDKNSSGPTKYCSFHKGIDPISNLTFANSGNFTDMSLSWTPSTSSITQAGQDDQSFSVYPNPASEVMYIDFYLKNDAPVSLDVFNIQGKHVASILKNTFGDIGKNSFPWHLRDNNHSLLPKGVYIIRLTENNNVSYKKVSLL